MEPSLGFAIGQWCIVFSGDCIRMGSQFFPALIWRQFHRHIDNDSDKRRQFWNEAGRILGQAFERLQVEPQFPVVCILSLFQRARLILPLDQYRCFDCEADRAIGAGAVNQFLDRPRLFIEPAAAILLALDESHLN